MPDDWSQYQDWTPGLSFADTRAELDREARYVFATEGRRMFITRHTVLGRMHQHKLEAWQHRQRLQIATQSPKEQDK